MNDLMLVSPYGFSNVLSIAIQKRRTKGDDDVLLESNRIWSKQGKKIIV